MAVERKCLSVLSELVESLILSSLSFSFLIPFYAVKKEALNCLKIQ